MDRVLHALADPTRRQILDLLVRDAMSAGDVAKRFPNLSRPAVSQHLAILMEAELVRREPQGRLRIYYLQPEPLRRFWENWLSKYEVFWDDRLAALKRAAEAGPLDGHEDEDRHEGG